MSNERNFATMIESTAAVLRSLVVALVVVVLVLIPPQRCGMSA